MNMMLLDVAAPSVMDIIFLGLPALIICLLVLVLIAGCAVSVLAVVMWFIKKKGNPPQQGNGKNEGNGNDAP